MLIYTSEFTGSAYTLEGDALLTTPLYEDLTFQTDIGDWVEVDFDTLEQGSDTLVHVEWVRDFLVGCTQE